MNDVTLLVVDDDHAIRESVAELLGEEGYLVETASDGTEACAKLAAVPNIALILLDVMMPRMDGIAFRRWQLDSPYAAIPVIVATAGAHPPQEIVEPPLAGQALIRKPFDVDALLGHIARLVGR